MDYFESIIKTLLERDGYWVRQSFKVGLTKEEKRDVARPSLPRPEIDLLAFKPGNREVLALEAKSFLDSPGVKLEDVSGEYKEPTGRYKMFTCTKYRQTILARLLIDLQASGLAGDDVSVRLGLVAGNVYGGKADALRAFMDSKGWFFWAPADIRKRVVALASEGYENDPAVITAKVLQNIPGGTDE